MNPIFIIGSPRSGTSILHWALTQHTKLWGSEESDFMIKLIPNLFESYRYGARRGQRNWLNKQAVTQKEFLDTFAQAIDGLYKSRSGGLRWIEKTPSYALVSDQIMEMFPNCKILHIVRDGRQAVCSMQEKFGWRFLYSVRTWKSNVSAAFDAGSRHTDSVLLIKYEDLILNPAATFERIFDFVGEASQSDVVDFIREPINSSPLCESSDPGDRLAARWRKWNPVKRLVFRAFAGDLMADLGYS